MTHNLTTNLHNAEVAFHRGIFRIRPVELHDLPGWWSRRVNWAVGSGWGRWDAQNGMDRLQRQFDASLIFDHWGSSAGPNGEPIFVTEPYADPTNPKFLAAVAGIADRLGVHARILGPWQSWWYPGSTVRVEFAECLSTPLCEGCKSREQLRDESRNRKRKASV